MSILSMGQILVYEDTKNSERKCHDVVVHDETVADVNKITKIVRVVGYVNGVPGFVGHPGVVNGASELFIAIWGDGAKHARSAVGIAELPLNSPVEIELTVEITD